MRAALQKIAKSVKSDRSSRASTSLAKPEAETVEAPGAASVSQGAAKTTAVTRPGGNDDAGDASRRKTDGAFGNADSK